MVIRARTIHLELILIDSETFNLTNTFFFNLNKIPIPILIKEARRSEFAKDSARFSGF